MDIEEYGHYQLLELLTQASVREPLIQAIMDTRHCLGPFRLNGLPDQLAVCDESRVALDATQRLAPQIFDAHTVEPLQACLNSLDPALEEINQPGRICVFPSRDFSRLLSGDSGHIRAICGFDYEVKNRFPSKLHLMESFRALSPETVRLAAVFDWPEDWGVDWNPSELQLCSRLRMVIVEAFCGEAFLVARRESESGSCRRLDNDVRTLEWRESFPHSRRRELNRL